MKKNMVYNFIYFLLIFLIILSNFILNPIQDLDELWNYNIARCVANGLVPYRDISMITSPLLAMITAIFLKLIANELIITRILGAILNLAVLYSLHKTMKILKVNNIINYSALLIIFYEMKNFMFLDYNWAVILIGIITFNFELKNLEKENKFNFKNELITGILVGIAICFKQSIGAMLAIASVIYKLGFIHKKEDVYTVTKSILSRILGILLPIYVLLMYLILNNALIDYIDYCYLGILTFSNKMPYKTLLSANSSIIIKVTSIMIPLLFLYLGIRIIINSIKEKSFEKILLFLSYSVALFTLTFPISNANHFLPGALVGIAILAYYINLGIKKIIKKYNIKNYKKAYILIYVIFILALVVSLINTIHKKQEELKEVIWIQDINHYKYIPIGSGLYNAIKEVDNYISKTDSKVYILDSDAVLYMVSLDRYNKDYDMFNIGNFGSKGEQGKIEDLKQEQDLVVLIKMDNKYRNWQNPKNVRKYIKENFEKIDEIFIFDVYKK